MAGAAGVVLLVVLALPWYDLLDGTLSAFMAFSFVDLWLAATALLAIAIPIVTAWRQTPAVPLAVAITAEAFSWIAVLLVLWRALDDPADGLQPTAMPLIGRAGHARAGDRRLARDPRRARARAQASPGDSNHAGAAGQRPRGAHRRSHIDCPADAEP